MMMIPRKHDFDLFDDVFGDSFFNEGASRLMKTDIKEKKNEYIIDIDLPGYDKEGIKLEIQDGYLTVHASVNKEENDEEKGRFVRKERYSGACSRSFYVGDVGLEKGEEAHPRNVFLFQQNLKAHGLHPPACVVHSLVYPRRRKKATARFAQKPPEKTGRFAGGKNAKKLFPPGPVSCIIIRLKQSPESREHI